MARRKLPHMEDVFIEELDNAADIYRRRRNKRIDANKDEKVAKVDLIEKMVKHGQTLYVTSDGQRVELNGKTEVKVVKNEEDNGDGE